MLLTGDYPDAADAARGALADAGATVAATVTLLDKQTLSASRQTSLPPLAALLVQGTAGRAANQQTPQTRWRTRA